MLICYVIWDKLSVVPLGTTDVATIVYINPAIATTRIRLNTETRSGTHPTLALGLVQVSVLESVFVGVLKAVV